MLRRRLLALVLDYLVVLGWMALLAVGALCVAAATSWDIADGLMPGRVGPQVVSFVLLTVPVGGYLWLTESGPRHATLGKRSQDLCVRTLSGGAPGRLRVLVRTVVKLAPWECAHTLVWQLVRGPADAATWVPAGLVATNVVAVAYVVMVARTGRGPHDLVAGTVVSRTPGHPAEVPTAPGRAPGGRPGGRPRGRTPVG